MTKYTDLNADTIDRWVKDGWEWGKPISHEDYLKAKEGEWKVILTPNKMMPRSWFPEDLKGKKILGLASGGAQQMPIFSAYGALCSILDYSPLQLGSERMVASREGYAINIVRADMSEPLPFPDDSFDIIFHAISNSYIENVKDLFKECARILKKGGILVSGLDNGINYITDDEITIKNSLPFNPLKNKEYLKQLEKNDEGIQFSHTLDEQIGGQLEAGFYLTDLFEDTNSEGRLKDLNIPCFIATRAIKH